MTLKIAKILEIKFEDINPWAIKKMKEIDNNAKKD